MSSSSGESEVWQFLVGAAVPVDVPVTAGWNIVGAPITTGDMHYQSLFRNSLTNTLSTFTGMYTVPDPAEMAIGEGYWLRFPASETVRLEGLSEELISLPLAGDWNMISGPNCSLILAAVGDPGGILLPGTLFGYDGDYIPVSTLAPGSGYWIRTSEPGVIEMDCTADKGGSHAIASLEGFRMLTITDAADSEQRLFFGGWFPQNTHELAYSVPPPAPGAVWQATFMDGRYAAQAGQATIDLDGAPFPLTLTLRGSPGDPTVTISALASDGRLIDEMDLVVGQPAMITDPEVVQLRIEGEELPTEYELDQNYPNPFNPATTIRFALPESSDVTLDVFDVLGRRVAVLLQADGMNAGWHDVHFDASRLASGVYLYRIRAGTFHKVKQMIILK